jgi:peptide/nickel transport system substrate-binding protein
MEKDLHTSTAHHHYLPSIIIVLLLSVPALSFIIVNSTDVYAQVSGNIISNRKGAYIDQVNFIHYLDENLAIQDLKAGKIDTYFFNIPPSLVSDVKNNPNLKAYESIGFNDDLLLNPAPPKSPATTGDFNPFSIRQVRFAMNYLIDRDFIVNEILKGYGVPMIDPYGVYSPEYLNIIDTVQSFGFRHDPTIAEKMISDALLHAGATRDSSSTSGKWAYNGKPVTISILIRSDIPVSKSIGEAVASDLENIGFNVVRDYGDKDKANSLIYGSDPQDLKWNIYTESSSGITFLKYSPGEVASSYAPWNANTPGAQNPSYWNYKNSTLDIITKKLVFGNFGSENERNNLLRNAVKDGIQESVRVYIATLTPTYIATNNVKGLVNDFAAGITSRLSLVNSRLEDNRTDMNVGTKQINVGAWNNIAGFNDIYSTEIINGIQDPATFNHPYTGETIPFRTPWIDIQTNGPHTAIPVAPDAIMWDPVGQHWKKEVENNGNNNTTATTATSKVTFNPMYGKWHNGIMMDKNDVLYGNYFQHEWGTNTGPTDKTVDSEYTSRAAASLKFDQGIRFLSDNKLESYTNFWHFDKSEIAGFATYWPVEPWEITAAEERLVTEGKFAFSKTDSTSKGIDWLSLLVPSHANAVKEELIKMKAGGYVPIALRGTVSVDEARKRYDASINWITQHSNAIIGNGPFYLDSYNPSGGVITIKAFRDNSYPFNVGYWNKYEHPRLATIPNVASDIPRTLRIGQPSNIVIHVNVDGKPSNNATVHYYLSNADGKVIASGIANPFPPLSSRSSSSSNTGTIGKFSVALGDSDTQKLSPGPNTLKLFAVSFDAYKPDIVTKTIIAVKSM